MQTLTGTILMIESNRSVVALPADATDCQVVVTRYHTIDEQLMTRVRPDHVVAPLFSTEFDIMDLAQRLHQIGFGGQLVAMAPPLPKPGLVLNEIMARCPGLKMGMMADARLSA